MKKVIIDSEFECLIMIENKQYLLSEGEEIVLEDCPILTSVLVYPIANQNNEIIPFSFIVKENIKAKNIESIMIKENLYITLIAYKINEKFFLKNYVLLGKKYTIKVTPSKVSFYNDSQGNTVHLTDAYSSFLTGIEANYMYVNLSGETNTLLLYNTKTNEIASFTGENFKIKNKTLAYLKKNKDIAKHAQILTFTLDTDSVTLKNEELLYEKNAPKIVSLIELMPIAFLEAIKYEDYDLAKTYLSDELNKTLEKEHLKAFFPKYNKIKLLDSSKTLARIALIDNLKYKIFSFKLLDKIIDITEED